MPRKKSTAETASTEISEEEILKIEGLEALESHKKEVQQEEQEAQQESEAQTALEKEGQILAKEMKTEMDVLHRKVKKAKLEIAHLVDLRQTILDNDLKKIIFDGQGAFEYKRALENLIEEAEGIDEELSSEDRVTILSRIEKECKDIISHAKETENKLINTKDELKKEKEILEDKLESFEEGSFLKVAFSFLKIRETREKLGEIKKQLNTTENNINEIQGFLGFEGPHKEKWITRLGDKGIIYGLEGKLFEVVAAYDKLGESNVMREVAMYTAKVCVHKMLDRENVPDNKHELIERALDKHLSEAIKVSRQQCIESDFTEIVRHLGNEDFRLKQGLSTICISERPYEDVAHSTVYLDLINNIREMTDLAFTEIDTEDDDLSRKKDKIIWDAENQLKNLNGRNNSYGVRFSMLPNGEGLHISSFIVEMLTDSKDDPALNKMFGKSLSDLDSRVYEQVPNSLTTKSDIDHKAMPRLAQFYPTPEVIRNLALLLGTYDTGGGLHISRQAFTRFSHRLDWEEKLEEAETVYPELKSMGDMLKKWNEAKQYDTNSEAVAVLRNISELPQAVFAENFNSKSIEDKNTAMLAMRAMSEENMIKSACEAGVLNESQKDKILELLSIIEVNGVELKKETGHYFGSQISGEIRWLVTGIFSPTNSPEEVADFRMILESVMIPLADKIIDKSKDEMQKESLKDLLNNNLIARLLNRDRKFTAGSKEQLTILASDVDKYQVLKYVFDNASGDIMQYSIFQNKEGLDYLVDFCEKFQGYPFDVGPIVKSIALGDLEKEWALQIPEKADELLGKDKESMFTAHAKHFLSSEESIAFARRAKQEYGKNIGALEVAARYLDNENFTSVQLENLPKLLPAVVNTESEEASKLLPIIASKSEYLLDTGHVAAFTNRVVGLYGNQAQRILEGIVNCRKEGVIGADNIELATEFLEHFRVLSPSTLAGYVEAKKHHQEAIYISELTSVCERMTGSKQVSEVERAKPYYEDLIKHVYAMNSSNATTYESNMKCTDRSFDLSGYKIKPRYELELFDAGNITLKEGSETDDVRISEVKEQILGVERNFASLGYDQESMLRDLGEKVDNIFKERLVNAGSISEEEVPNLTREEKMMLIMADTLYSTEKNLSETSDLKQLIIQYEFTLYEDVRDYIRGTSDRVSGAPNKEYALLCEMGEFFNDRIKDVHRNIADKAYSSETVKKAMEVYFEKFSQGLKSEGRQNKINRLQADKLGLTDAFIKQIGKTLEKRTGRKYTDAKIKRIISLYEKIGGDFSEKTSTSEDKLTKAFYGQLKSQREKTIAALRELTGKDIDPKTIHLDELNIGEVIKAEEATLSGIYDEDQFASYSVEKMIGLFAPEQGVISDELAKFESTSGTMGQKLNAYITKTKESANARMVGGVCVAGDNPPAKQNQWDMENYFQMVFQDPESKQCQGLVLLHSVEGEIEVAPDKIVSKVLTASINPSSTYLYTVDEVALFEGIMKNLEIFASENGFDQIALSSNKNIRTNRTGGKFEKAIDDRVSKFKNNFTFKNPARFSHSPNYQMSNMDVVWERK